MLRIVIGKIDSDIVRGGGGSRPEYLVNLNGALLFGAGDLSTGEGLWKSDGTPDGTLLVAQPTPLWQPLFLTNVHGTVFFSASDPGYGQELWAVPLASLVGDVPTSTPTATATPTETSTPTATAIPTSTSTPIIPQNIIGTISSSGGSAATDDGAVSLEFPSGAITSTVTISYTRLTTPSQPLGDDARAIRGFVLEARNIAGEQVHHFLHPYTLVIHYTDAELAASGVKPGNLNVVFWNGNAWVNILPCTGCYIDQTNHNIVLILDHFTEFALVGRLDGKVFIPIVER